MHSHILPDPIQHSRLFRMVHFSLRVIVGKVLQSKDGCPIENVEHDGGEDDAISTIPGMIGKSPSPPFSQGGIPASLIRHRQHAALLSAAKSIRY